MKRGPSLNSKDDALLDNKTYFAKKNKTDVDGSSRRASSVPLSVGCFDRFKRKSSHTLKVSQQFSLLQCPEEIITLISSFLLTPTDKLNFRVSAKRILSILQNDILWAQNALSSSYTFAPPYPQLWEKIGKDQQEEIDYLSQHPTTIGNKITPEVFNSFLVVSQKKALTPFNILLRHRALNRLNTRIILAHLGRNYHRDPYILNLSCCHLTRFPCAFTDFPQVWYMDLSHNYLKTIPALPNYVLHVNLAYNRLERLPALSADLLLETLNIENNKLSELPPTISHLWFLRRVRVNDNFLRTLPPALAQGHYFHSVGYPLQGANIFSTQQPIPPAGGNPLEKKPQLTP